MITYGRMANEDCEEVAMLEKEIFGMDAWSVDDFRESLCCDYALYMVAKDDEKGIVIGCAGVRNICGDGDITNVFIHPGYRQRGIGEKLVSNLMEEGRSIGVRNYTLETRLSNLPAIRLYEKLGFVSEGIRPGFYEHPKEDAMIFWKREEGNV